MKLRRVFGGHAARANKPHRGHGQWGRSPPRQKPLNAGAHTAQRVSGFNDRKGYKESPRINVGQLQSGRIPRIDREAGHYHPVGHGSRRVLDRDTADTHRFNRAAHTVRDMGKLGEGRATAPQGDSSKRRGPVGNSQGSSPPGVGKGTGVRGSTDSHLGTTGRGDKGRLGMHDGHKGKQPKALSENLSHAWFESLGADHRGGK